MSTTTIVLLVLGLLAAALLVSVLVVVVARRLSVARGVEMYQQGEDYWSIRTPVGRASARLVVHENHGKVFEVHTYFRGEEPTVSYVPPAPRVLYQYVQRTSNEAWARRAAAKGRRQ